MWRSPLPLLAALACAASARAAEMPPPPPDPHAVSGAVLFSDDFADTTLARWRPDRAGVWSVTHGMLRGALPDERQKHSLIEAGSDAWTDVALDVDVCQTRGVDKGAVLRVGKGSGVGVDLRGTGYNDVLLRQREWPLGRAAVPLANGQWHHLRFEARGRRYRVWVDGALVLERVAEQGRGAGHIALAAYTGGVGECEVWYDHVVVTAAGSAPAARKGRARAAR